MTDPAESVDITSPIAWQRWLSIQLVRLRKAAGVKQADAAKAIGASVGKLSYLENGERPISVEELDALLPTYGLSPKEAQKYVQAARSTDQRHWLQAWTEQDVGADALHFAGLEDAASQIRAYAVPMVHGLLQTPEYARAVIEASSMSAPEVVDSLVELRVARQRHARGTPLSVVLDEATLHRTVGGATVMRKQLAHLLTAATKQPQLSLRVLPYSAGAHPGIYSPFTILNFPWPDDPGIVLIESTMRSSEFLESRSDVYDFSGRFLELTNLALDEKSSAELIGQVAQEM
jgi:transcriptional regulator with XRE-family HTH domain